VYHLHFQGLTTLRYIPEDGEIQNSDILKLKMISFAVYDFALSVAETEQMLQGIRRIRLAREQDQWRIRSDTLLKFGFHYEKDNPF
jgi:hypothetical protein